MIGICKKSESFKKFSLELDRNFLLSIESITDSSDFIAPTISLFQLIHDKDAFQKFYKEHLTSRIDGGYFNVFSITHT